MTDKEHVVLVDEQNQVIGTMLKSAVHTLETPLHRGFSAFLFNNKKKLLLQQRSRFKKTWPYAWSNSCCGHPALHETNIDAVYRRVKYELGGEIQKIKEISPYRYCFEKDGIVENEICPILIGVIREELHPNPEEVESIEWVTWSDFLHQLEKNPEKYSPWCREEALLLNSLDALRYYIE